MQKLLIAAAIMILLGGVAHARCGYYVGYGYRCFGDKGGTGGKAFKQMDENSKKCGYFDPGCQHGKSKPKTKSKPSSPQSK